MPNRYPGSRVRITATFTDSLNADALTDPTTVTFTVEAPGASGDPRESTAYENAALENPSVGVWYLDVDCPNAGVYEVNVHGEGTLAAVNEKSWRVTPSRVSAPA